MLCYDFLKFDTLLAFVVPVAAVAPIVLLLLEIVVCNCGIIFIGSHLGLKYSITYPSLLIKNFAKFHGIS